MEEAYFTNMGSAIMDAIDSYDSNITSKELAQDFLLTEDLEKDQTNRLISWLISLNIIKPVKSEYFVSLYNLVKEYKESYDNHFGKNNPLDIIPYKQALIIKKDLVRSVHTFGNPSQLAGFPQEYLDNAIPTVERILALLSSTDKFYSYLQGFDRYIFLTYHLVLLFAFTQRSFFDLYNCSPEYFSEAITFFIGQKLLRITDIQSILKNNEQAINHFTSLEPFIQTNFPNVYRKLTDLSVSPAQFGLGWRIALFSDLHTAKETFLIWDNVIAHVNDFQAYFDDLFISHLEQIEPRAKNLLLHDIQSNKDWDTAEIVKRANKRFNGRNKKSTPKFIIVVTIVALLMVICLYLNRQNDEIVNE
ncbi:hypothetical protein GPJ56_004254 [Histomonas meleagridis]|uniref:uncharacterized protein n=1 Tax=Histomonas meleagridis TaxID=135588 RepID=UPI00355AC041|nr:hypothetical protein GPJ56_004254 [Histomonas meleagridis]KAH0800532.1 hypothetical protein GO595_006735 [Histomonas meleagridis]